MNSGVTSSRRGDSSSSSAAPITVSAVFLPLLLPLAVAAGLVALNSGTGTVTTRTANGGRGENGGAAVAPASSAAGAKDSWRRWLQGGGASSSRKFDVFYADLDVCRVNSDSSVDDDDHEEDFERCNATKFPTCRDDELICYNRRPSRSLFYNDTRQPVFFIDYRNVYCYPENWEGCSSCSPGRLCLSESRCVLEDANYPCDQWF